MIKNKILAHQVKLGMRIRFPTSQHTAIVHKIEYSGINNCEIFLYLEYAESGHLARTAVARQQPLWRMFDKSCLREIARML
jgi:hypothetical protein